MDYGAVLQRSPKPLQVVGYEYEDGCWPHGQRREVYRMPVDEAHYKTVVRRIKRTASGKRADKMLFDAFKPSNN